VRAAIETEGAQLIYSPPYSPDLKTIEFAFSKLKWLLLSAAAQTVSALSDTIGSLLDRFSPAERTASFGPTSSSAAGTPACR